MGILGRIKRGLGTRIQKHQEERKRFKTAYNRGYRIGLGLEKEPTKSEYYQEFRHKHPTSSIGFEEFKKLRAKGIQQARQEFQGRKRTKEFFFGSPRRKKMRQLHRRRKKERKTYREENSFSELGDFDDRYVDF